MISLTAVFGVAVLLSCADSLVGRWSERLEAGDLQHVIADQELYWPLTQDRMKQRMELWFLPPNRVKVCYSSPDSQAVIANGREVWTIVPGNNQALVRQQDASLTWRDTPLGSFLSLEAHSCSTTWMDGGEAGLSIQCVDRGGQNQFTRIELFVPDGALWPSEARLVDISENVTIYRILSWEEVPHTVSDDSLFRPDLPPEMEVVFVD